MPRVSGRGSSRLSQGGVLKYALIVREVLAKDWGEPARVEIVIGDLDQPQRQEYNLIRHAGRLSLPGSVARSRRGPNLRSSSRHDGQAQAGRSRRVTERRHNPGLGPSRSLTERVGQPADHSITQGTPHALP